MPIRARVQLDGDGVQGGGVSTTYWRQLSPTPTQAELDGIGESLRQSWSQMSGEISDIVAGSTDMSFSGELEDLDDATGQVTAVYQAAPWTLAANGQPIAPKSTQGMIQLRTGVYINGRELRGRIFTPAVNKTCVTPGGGLDSTGVTSLQQGADSLVLAADGEDYWMVVYSPTHGTHAPVTTATPGSKLAVLRSRRD